MAKKRISRTNSTLIPTIQAAFEQFQRQNTVKNLSQDTIKFYSSKSRRLFCFLGDTEQRIDTITQETVEDYPPHVGTDDPGVSENQTRREILKVHL